MAQKKSAAPVLAHRDGKELKQGQVKTCTFIVRGLGGSVKHLAGIGAVLLGIGGICAIAAGNIPGVLAVLLGLNAALGVRAKCPDRESNLQCTTMEENR